MTSLKLYIFKKKTIPPKRTIKGDKLINEFGIFRATNNKKVINFKSFFALKKLNSSSKLIRMTIESITTTTINKLFINS
jgi:hypothetical protein